MMHANFVNRLTDKQICDFLTTKCGYRKVQLIEKCDVKTECLLNDAQEIENKIISNVGAGRIVFFTASYSERYIHLFDNAAYVVEHEAFDETRRVIARIRVPNEKVEDFLYSVFGKEYEAFWLKCVCNKRLEIDRHYQVALRALEQNTAATLQRFKNISD